MYGVRSPMIFVGRDHYADNPLVDALRELAAGAGWEQLVRVVDDEHELLSALRELMPLAPSAEWPVRRRAS